MSAVTDILLAPDVRPFAISAAIMLTLGGIELLTMLVGFLDQRTHRQGFRARNRERQRHRRPVPLDQCGTAAAVDPDHPGARRVRDRGLPAAGYCAQCRHWPCRSRSRRLPPQRFSLPAIRVTSRGIARIIPRDETYAVDEADFVGHVAEVSIGPLDQGLPGRSVSRMSSATGILWSHAPVPNPRRFRSAPASCWSTATPEASSPFPHQPTSLRNSTHHDRA